MRYIHRCVPVLAALLCAAVVTAQTIIPVNTAPVIRVAFFGLDGFNNIDDIGRLSGFGYEYLQEIAKYTNWQYEFITETDAVDQAGTPTGEKRPITLTDALQLVAAGKLDIIGSIKKTDERETVLAYPDYSCGDQYRMLTVRKDDDRYEYGIYDTFAGMRVGLQEGSESNKEFDAYCAKNHFSQYTKRYYKTYAELECALAAGEIDSIFTSNLRRGNDEKAIAILTPFPQYFATTKGNTYVLNGLNYALSKITVQKPDFGANLYKKYYSDNSIRLFSMTQSEKEYVESLGALTVKVSTALPPLSYVDENGEIRGTAVDMMRYVQDITGIRVKWLIDTNESADIIIPWIDDSIWNQHTGMRTTTPRVFDSVCICAGKNIREYASKSLKIAYMKGTYIGDIYAAGLGYGKPEEYDSILACLQAVESGKADISYIPSYMAQCLFRQQLPRNTSSTVISEAKLAYGFAVPKSGDTRLFYILNKAIESIPDEFIQTSLNEHLLSYTTRFTLLQWVYQNPIQTIVMVMTVFALLMLTVIFMQRRQNVTLREQNRRIEEAIRQKDRMKKLTETDELTGLANKLHFQNVVRSRLDDRTSETYMLLFMDIDNFKKLNDEIGHLAGDSVLQYISALLLKHFSSDGDITGRFGGDEFYAFVRFDSEERALERVENFRREVAELWKEKPWAAALSRGGCAVTVSIGIVACPENGTTLRELLDKADKALYEAKRQGKGQTRKYRDIAPDSLTPAP